jgi:hypothetical protein
MNYTEDLSNFKTLTGKEMALPGAPGHVFPGIGVTATESRLDPLETIAQIQAIRNAGASGFVLYCLGRTLEQETLPVLAGGILEGR